MRAARKTCLREHVFTDMQTPSSLPHPALSPADVGTAFSAFIILRCFLHITPTLVILLSIYCFDFMLYHQQDSLRGLAMSAAARSHLTVCTACHPCHVHTVIIIINNNITCACRLFMSRVRAGQALSLQSSLSCATLYSLSV